MSSLTGLHSTSSSSSSSSSSPLSLQSSASSATLFKFPQYVDEYNKIHGSHTGRAFALSDLEKQLLQQQLNEFQPDLWLHYLCDEFKPKHKANVDKILKGEVQCTWTDIKNPKAVLDMERSVNACLERMEMLLKIPDVLWSKPTDDMLPNIIEFCAIVMELQRLCHTIRKIPAEGLNNWNRLVLNSEEESDFVWKYCAHICMEIIATKRNPTGKFFMGLPTRNSGKHILVVKQDGLWQYNTAISEMTQNMHCVSWRGSELSQSVWKNMSVLMNGRGVFDSVPFISISFQPRSNLSILNRLEIKDFTELRYSVTVVYCSGNGQSDNSTVFEGEFGPMSMNMLIPFNVPANSKQFYDFAAYAQVILSQEWMSSMRCERKNDGIVYYPEPYERVSIFPSKEEEMYEDALSLLDMALEDVSKPENAMVIRWIGDLGRFQFTKEEIQEVQNELSQPQSESSSVAMIEDDESVTVPLLVYGHAMKKSIHKRLKKVKEKSTKKQEKTTQISKETKTEEKFTGISKDFLKEEISEATDMSRDLQEQALEILSGYRISSKKREGKFFMEMAKYQAAKHGCKVEQQRKTGSHYTIKLVKRGKGKNVTLMATSLVEHHGRDSSSATSVYNQQQSLLNLFTPLQ